MKFLKSFPGSVFQTFKDHKGAKGHAHVYETYDEGDFKLANKLGCGVYFTPNGFKGGRKLENLNNINAVYADLDIAKEGEEVRITDKTHVIKAILGHSCRPNFVIETKNGVQPIWLIETPENESIEIVGKSCVAIMKGIVKWSIGHGCKGDKVYDLNRVLRLPGYYHMKGEPYLCRAKKFHDKKFLVVDLLKAFPFHEEKAKYVKPDVKYRKNDISLAIDRIEFQELIIRAFASVGRSASFDNQKRIVLDGRLTGTHQGKVNNGDFLASNSHEPFEGNRITATADILQVTNKEARAWIVEEYHLKEGVKTKKQERAKEDAKKIIEEIKEIRPKKRGYYTWGTKVLTESFAPIKSDTFSIIGAGYGVGKTTFCVDVAIKNAELGHKVLYLSLEMTKEELMDQFGRNAASITIPEEIYNKIPQHKKEKYDKRRAEIESIKTFTLRGFKGGKRVTWECLTELMDGEWDLIFVDNFNLIARLEGFSKHEHEGELSKKFLNYAAKKQTPIMVVHHYSKGGAREEIKTGYSLSGNAEVENDAMRIVLLERKRINKEDQEEPTAKEKAVLKVMLDKGRGYEGGINKIIYFYKGSFYDEYPEEKEWDYTDPDAWLPK